LRPAKLFFVRLLFKNPRVFFSPGWAADVLHSLPFFFSCPRCSGLLGGFFFRTLSFTQMTQWRRPASLSSISLVLVFLCDRTLTVFSSVYSFPPVRLRAFRGFFFSQFAASAPRAHSFSFSAGLVCRSEISSALRESRSGFSAPFFQIPPDIGIQVTDPLLSVDYSSIFFKLPLFFFFPFSCLTRVIGLFRFFVLVVRQSYQAFCRFF